MTTRLLDLDIVRIQSDLDNIESTDQIADVIQWATSPQLRKDIRGLLKVFKTLQNIKSIIDQPIESL